MLRGAPWPLFYRQTITAAPKTNAKEVQAAEVKEDTAAPDFNTTGFYPPQRLAQSYVIWQRYGPLFTPAEALEKGTVFPALYSPYPL